MQKVNAHTVPIGEGASTHGVGEGLTAVSEHYKHLNFKIPPEFHREFKTWAASHDISMTALLVEAFNTLREQHSGNEIMK